MHPSTKEDDKQLNELHLQKKEPRSRKGIAGNKMKPPEPENILNKPFFVSDLQDRNKAENYFRDLFKHLIEYTRKYFWSRWQMVDNELAEKVVGEALDIMLVKGWPEGNLKNYAWGTVRNRVADYFRKNAMSRIDYNVEIEDCPEQEDDLEQIMETEMLMSACMDALKQLPYTLRRIMELRYEEAKSFSEIGTALNMDEGHARVQHYNAKKRLREYIKKRNI